MANKKYSLFYLIKDAYDIIYGRKFINLPLPLNTFDAKHYFFL